MLPATTPRSVSGKAATPRAKATPRWHPSAARHARSVVARGILDSYRKDKGIPIPPADAAAAPTASGSKTTTVLERKSSSSTTKAWVDKILRRNDSLDEGDAGDDDAPCPVECVAEIKSIEELQEILTAAGDSSLVVVDFFKTACGACKYIMPGFVKLCQASAASSSSQPPVFFAKHNVFDDEEGAVTDLAKKYNIRSVPKFVFFRRGEPVESFATRDKDKVAAAIIKHAEPGSVEFGDSA